jgi:hypothetical protein
MEFNFYGQPSNSWCGSKVVSLMPYELLVLHCG